MYLKLSILSLRNFIMTSLPILRTPKFSKTCKKKFCRLEAIKKRNKLAANLPPPSKTRLNTITIT